MKTLGNILWLLLEGIWLALAWLFAGVIMCITIIGIPFGLQCFKIAKLVLWPMGKKIKVGGGTGKFILNLIWIIFCGWEIALASAVMGLVWCVTVIGIPFGLQSFKLARLALTPFGSKLSN